MPIADSLQLSFLASASQNWITTPELKQHLPNSTPEIFLSVTSFLISNPNRNTSHVFRADVLHDSAGILQTPEQKERDLLTNSAEGAHHEQEEGSEGQSAQPAVSFSGFQLKRTVVRRIIPRNPKRDRALDQTCHFYANEVTAHNFDAKESHLVVYTPHLSAQEDPPWYHPAVRAIALLYEGDSSLGHGTNHKEIGGELSLHFLPLTSSGVPDGIPNRLERTLLGLISTHSRLIRGTSQDAPQGPPRPYKDNIIPQHVLQNTYMRLKDKYAVSLIANWVETTEPSKHVFEDISISAFLIELWRLMYDEGREHDSRKTQWRPFPGFVDIACGNGVLVHVLLSEGYRGWGFDARHRKTWSTFPTSTQDRLKEAICTPQPFKDALGAPDEHRSKSDPQPIDLSSTTTHTGIFEKGTFVISNHADELTIWTPLLGMLSNPACPLPFLAIPCCSHALSGARYRYPAPKTSTKKAQTQTPQPADTSSTSVTLQEQEPELKQPVLDPQPATGDLKALRSAKQEATQDPTSTTSAYGCLTAKVVGVAEEIGYDIEKTILRIPSTRNVGVIGGLNRYRRKTDANTWSAGYHDSGQNAQAEERVQQIVERESRKDGGVREAAALWMERCLGLQKTGGRGKVKGGAQHS